MNIGWPIFLDNKRNNGGKGGGCLKSCCLVQMKWIRGEEGGGETQNQSWDEPCRCQIIHIARPKKRPLFLSQKKSGAIES